VTDTSTPVAPPAALPWVLADVATAALAVLRLDPADVDADRINDAADTATTLIDSYLDHAVAPASIPGPVFDAAVNLTVELYRRKDAPWGVLDSWSADGASIQLSSDVMRGVRTMLVRYKARWGIG
jgi:hypothetical protein